MSLIWNYNMVNKMFGPCESSLLYSTLIFFFVLTIFSLMTFEVSRSSRVVPTSPISTMTPHFSWDTIMKTFPYVIAIFPPMKYRLSTVSEGVGGKTRKRIKQKWCLENTTVLLFRLTQLIYTIRIIEIVIKKGIG